MNTPSPPPATKSDPNIDNSARPAARRALRLFVDSGIFIPIAFLALMAWLDPFDFAADYDYDEGINLMKTLLVDRGFQLYTEIWSDQPPLLTFGMVWWLDLVGESVENARILIALLSALLLWSLYIAARRWVSAFAATGAILILLVSGYYLRLSASVMVGLPALALSTCAMAVTVAGRNRRWTLIASGVLMALALQTKLFVAVTIPALALYLMWGEVERGETRHLRRKIARLLIWSAATAVTYVTLGVLFGALKPELLLNTHFGEQVRELTTPPGESRRFLLDFARQHALYLLLALAGVIYAFQTRNRGPIIPSAWFLTSLIALAFHSPLWYHHVMLLTVPMAWLCAFALQAWVDLFNGLADASRLATVRSRAALLIISAVFASAALVFYPSPLGKRLEEQAQLYRPLYIWELPHQLRAEGAAEPGLVFTDRPFYAFQAGQPVVPSIAVISRKRIETDAGIDETLLDALVTYRPPYVILERFTGMYSEAVMDELDRHYELVMQNEPGRYYKRTRE